MLLDGLPDILRRAGLPVEVMDDFHTNRHGAMSGVRAIVVHHTAGSKTGDRGSLRVVRYGRPGLPGPLSQLFLTRAGVWLCVSNGLAWHAGVVRDPRFNNATAIGIEAEATGLDAWPSGQYESYARGVAALVRAWPGAVIVGHKEACSPPGRKSDPNFDMNAFRARVAAIGGGAPVDVAPPPPVEFPDHEENRMLILFSEVQNGETTEHHFHGQRTCEAGGGSHIAGSAWVSFSSGWGGCNVSIAAQDGKGGVTFILGSPSTLFRIENNTNAALPLPAGSRIVTIEGLRDNIDTVPACDVYNLR